MGVVINMNGEQMILNRASALGNSKKKLMHVASDLITRDGNFKAIAGGTYLSIHTIRRVADLTETETGAEYRPNADTLERIFKYFGAEIRFNYLKVSKKFMNEEKE